MYFGLLRQMPEMLSLGEAVGWFARADLPAFPREHFSRRSEVMKSSTRGLAIAVLFVLCCTTVSNAAVITTITSPAASLSQSDLGSETDATIARFGNYGTYKAVLGAGNAFTTANYLWIMYDLGTLYTDNGVTTATELMAKVIAGEITITATLSYYNRATATTGTVDTVYVAQAAGDVSAITGTNYLTWLSKKGGDATTLVGTNVCTATDDGTKGWHSVDVTSILTSWLGVATNYGLDIGSTSSSDENIYDGSKLPYLVITVTEVPEPATMGLILVGGIAALLRRRRIA
jgi:hypothetical protein